MSLFIPTGSTEPPDVSTYKELGQVWGVCWQRVRQIERRALEKLKIAVEAEAKAAGKTPAEWLTGE